MTDITPTSWVTRLTDGRERRALSVYTLTVTKGADQGHRLRVEEPRITVGALDGTSLKLSDPTVSGLHAELCHDLRGIQVRDLGSRNGTWVNGVRITEAYLTGAATLSLGATELAFEPQAGVTEPVAAAEDRFGPLLGKSVLMRELFARLATFARTDSTILITGETGTGKELVAEAIVEASQRAGGPVVVVDCGSLAPTLVEDELFGHERGAFTGATSSKPGAFERASKGTVFLDEVGELPLELQPRLLRVLERREVQRLGGRAPLSVDVRILAATHKNLEADVNAGRFRADLFYRLSVLRVVVPALRDRPEDIPGLVAAFAEGTSMDPRTMQRFVEHGWPGNVRELRNAVERWRAGADPLAVSSGGAGAQGPSAPGVTLDQPYLAQKERLVSAFEREYARMLLAACKGNLALGSRIAGVSRMAVVKLLQRAPGEPPAS